MRGNIGQKLPIAWSLHSSLNAANVGYQKGKPPANGPNASFTYLNLIGI